MSKLETLREYAQQKTEQQVLSLLDAPEMIRQVQAMRQELAQLPEAMASQIASSLDPMEKMAKVLDQGLDTQRAIMEPLIQAAVESLQKEMQTLSRDKVKRSVNLAREYHRKNKQMSKELRRYIQKNKGLMEDIDYLQAQVSQQKALFLVMSAISGVIAVFLVLMTFWRFL